MIDVDKISGYVLEEVIAALLRDNGYMLLVHKRQDPDALDVDHHGLVVKGRGANHQVDALGQLLFSVPFSLPIRLFAEAKCYKATIGVEVVRNALGLINDVNERYAFDGALDFPLRRHQYRYALFSASGFSPSAQSFALTHQISLVDLQGPAFSGMRSAAQRAAEDLHEAAEGEGLASFPLKQMRNILRRELGTWSFGSALGDSSDNQQRGRRAKQPPQLPESDLVEIAQELKGTLDGNLLLGFPQGPFVLVLQPDDPQAFDVFLRESPYQVEVDIRFALDARGKGEWVIVPHSDRGALVRFGIPPLLEAWLLTDGRINPDRVEKVKAELLPYISIFHHDGQLTQLRYRKLADLQTWHDMFGARTSKLRHDLAASEYAFHSPYEGDVMHRADKLHVSKPVVELGTARSVETWSLPEMVELIEQLKERGFHWQIDVIKAAAAMENCRISRRQAIRIGRGYGPTDIRRLLRPVNKVFSTLIQEDIVRDGLAPPLKSIKDRGRVLFFEACEDFRSFPDVLWT